MNSLISDLKADTIMLNSGIIRKINRVNAIDSVFVFFYNNKNVQKISGKIYKILRRTTFDQRLVRNTITINQLKNAGGMRLVRNRQVADSIAAYDFNCERYEPYNENYLSHQQLNYRQFEKLVAISDLLPLYVENRSTAIVTNIPDSIDIKVNTTSINEYLGLLMQTKIFALQEILEFERLNISAVNLMALIKEEYYLKYKSLWKYMHTSYGKKKMDALSLGIFNVIPCCVLWVFSREYTRTVCRKNTVKNSFIQSFIEDLKNRYRINKADFDISPNKDGKNGFTDAFIR
jgi:hypothetical protein